MMGPRLLILAVLTMGVFGAGMTLSFAVAPWLDDVRVYDPLLDFEDHPVNPAAELFALPAAKSAASLLILGTPSALCLGLAALLQRLWLRRRLAREAAAWSADERSQAELEIALDALFTRMLATPGPPQVLLPDALNTLARLVGPARYRFEIFLSELGLMTAPVARLPRLGRAPHPWRRGLLLAGAAISFLFAGLYALTALLLPTMLELTNRRQPLVGVQLGRGDLVVLALGGFALSAGSVTLAAGLARIWKLCEREDQLEFERCSALSRRTLDASLQTWSGLGTPTTGPALVARQKFYPLSRARIRAAMPVLLEPEARRLWAAAPELAQGLRVDP